MNDEQRSPQERLALLEKQVADMQEIIAELYRFLNVVDDQN